MRWGSNDSPKQSSRPRSAGSAPLPAPTDAPDPLRPPRPLPLCVSFPSIGRRRTSTRGRGWVSQCSAVVMASQNVAVIPSGARDPMDAGSPRSPWGASLRSRMTASAARSTNAVGDPVNPISSSMKPISPETRAISPETRPVSPETRPVSPETRAISPETRAISPETRAFGDSRRRSSDAEPRFLGSPKATIGAIEGAAGARGRVREAITRFCGGTIAVVSGITVTRGEQTALVYGQTGVVSGITGIVSGITGFAGSLGRSTRSTIRFVSPTKR